MHLKQNRVSVESVTLRYRPQAFFKTLPITRSSATIPGHREAVLSVAFSPCGRQLASGSGDSTVRFWDLSTQLPLHECRGHTSWVLAVAWAPDARLLVSGGRDGQVRLWDPKTGEARGVCKGHKEWITSIAWRPAHMESPARLFVTGSKDGTARVWNAQSKLLVFCLGGHTRAVSAVKWGGEDVIYTASRDCMVFMWNAQKGSIIRQLKGHAHWVNTLALSSEHALRTGAFDHRGQAPADPEAQREAALKCYQEATQGQPERLVSGSDDFTLFLWEPASSKSPKARLLGHQALVNQVQFSPDGQWIARVFPQSLLDRQIRGQLPGACGASVPGGLVGRQPPGAQWQQGQHAKGVVGQDGQAHGGPSRPRRRGVRCGLGTQRHLWSFRREGQGVETVEELG